MRSYHVHVCREEGGAAPTLLMASLLAYSSCCRSTSKQHPNTQWVTMPGTPRTPTNTVNTKEDTRLVSTCRENEQQQWTLVLKQALQETLQCVCCQGHEHWYLAVEDVEAAHKRKEQHCVHKQLDDVDQLVKEGRQGAAIHSMFMQRTHRSTAHVFLPLAHRAHHAPRPGLPS